MIKFKTQYDPQTRFFHNLGSPLKVKRSGSVDSKGNIILEETGVENLYEFIQSFKDSVDINVLIKRYQNGDITALQRRQGVFIDTVGMPKTYAEALNLVHKGEEEFNKLPVDVKEQFNNNYMEYIATAGSKEWYDKLDIKPVEPAIESIGKENTENAES